MILSIYICRKFVFTFFVFTWKATRLHLPVFSIFPFSTTFPEYWGIRKKKCFTDHQTAITVQLFVAIKGNFSGLLFFWTSRKEREFPREYFINVVTCLFAYIKIDINPVLAGLLVGRSVVEGGGRVKLPPNISCTSSRPGGNHFARL